ncbi:hypothetical protein CCACVL1_19995, partial [Corchorus capsularis]
KPFRLHFSSGYGSSFWGFLFKDEPYDAVETTARDGDRCTTSKSIRMQCKTEEVKPRKFIRKCEKTEEVLKQCVGRLVIMARIMCLPF